MEAPDPASRAQHTWPCSSTIKQSLFNPQGVCVCVHVRAYVCLGDGTRVLCDVLRARWPYGRKSCRVPGQIPTPDNKDIHLSCIHTHTHIILVMPPGYPWLRTHTRLWCNKKTTRLGWGVTPTLTLLIWWDHYPPLSDFYVPVIHNGHREAAQCSSAFVIYTHGGGKQERKQCHAIKVMHLHDRKKKTSVAGRARANFGGGVAELPARPTCVRACVRERVCVQGQGWWGSAFWQTMLLKI